jgi:squalene monooxygenase
LGSIKATQANTHHYVAFQIHITSSEAEREREHSTTPHRHLLRREEVLEMVDSYALGFIITFVITFFSLYNFLFSRKNRSEPTTTENITTATGECRSFNPNGDVDIIIVGAGVAGSALAYTLGKVFYYFHFNIYFFL